MNLNFPPYTWFYSTKPYFVISVGLNLCLLATMVWKGKKNRFCEILNERKGDLRDPIV